VARLASQILWGMYSSTLPPRPQPAGEGVWLWCTLKIGKDLAFNTVEAQEPLALIRAFKRAHKDVVERLSGVDFAPISSGEASAVWERTGRKILLETNLKHDWEHRKSPWFRLYYHFY
jgi:hypothetical protein